MAVTDCDPLWPDDEDEQAWLDLHTPAARPLADHGRPCGGRPVPQHRPLEDVLETL